MATKLRAALKALWITGYTPTQTDFSDLFDSTYLKGDEDLALSSTVTSGLADKVDRTTTVNGHALTGNVTVSKSDVGLGNVDNTSDLNKPVSTATQIAINNGDAIKTDKLITANRQTASYTLVLGDADKLVEMNVATANNLTIPQNSSVAFDIGTQIIIAQYGAGQTTIVADTNVTLRSDTAKLKISAQYCAVTLIKIATNEWYVFGGLSA